MIQELKRTDYNFHLLFPWLPSADTTVNRVRERVSLRVHNAPEEVIRRHYDAGRHNFLRIYSPIAASGDSTTARPRGAHN